MMADVQKPAETMLKIDAAAFLGVSMTTLSHWIDAGRIREGRAVIAGRLRAVVNAADVRRVKAERETVQWQDGED